MFRMIIVEDEPRLLRQLKDKITSLSSDFKVVGMYNNGEDALIELQWTQPHAIITDIRMPVMDGIELVRSATQLMPDTISAFVSGHDDFPYMKEAIHLGVADYMLKPASDQEIASLLEKMKSKLMLNRSLMEKALARQINEASLTPDSRQTNWKEVALELFYHGNYLLLFAWSPLGDVPASFRIACNNLLREGEKCTPLPTSTTMEEILLVGIHSWTPERHEELIAILNGNEISGVTVAMALSTSGIQPIPALIAECRKQVLTQSRFDNHCFWVSDLINEDVTQLFEPLRPILLRLAHCISRQQKQVFFQEWESIFWGTNIISPPLTRKGWEYLLRYISLSVSSLTKETIPWTFECRLNTETELVEEVWKARSLADLYAQTKEIWSIHFFRNESEQTAHRDWAKEARQHIDGHFHENISLTSVADFLQLNPAYLNRVFKRAFQTSIPDYLVKLRIEKACQFIREHPFVLIKEIAEHVGYPDPYHFSKVFKQQTGFSPSDYKAKAE